MISSITLQNQHIYKQYIQQKILLDLVSTNQSFIDILINLNGQHIQLIESQVYKLSEKLQQIYRQVMIKRLKEILINHTLDDQKLRGVLKGLKNILSIELFKGFCSYQLILSIALSHQNIDVFFEAIEILVNKIELLKTDKYKETIYRPLVKLLKQLKKYNQAQQIQQQNNGKRKKFIGLTQQQLLKLQLFAIVKLYYCNKTKYLIEEHQIQKFYTIVKEKEYKWILEYFLIFKFDKVALIYQDIIATTITINPSFSYVPNTKYVNPKLIDSISLDLAINYMKGNLHKQIYEQNCIIQTEDRIHFKFTPHMYDLYQIGIFMSVINSNLILNNQELELLIHKLIKFLHKVIANYKKEFLIIKGKQITLLEDKAKLEILNANLKVLTQIFTNSNQKQFGKVIFQSNILQQILDFLKWKMQIQQNNDLLWDIFQKTFKNLKSIIDLNNNISALSNSKYIQKIIYILQSFEFPKESDFLLDVVQFVAKIMDAVFKKNPQIKGLFKNQLFTQKILECYFIKKEFSSEFNQLLEILDNFFTKFPEVHNIANIVIQKKIQSLKTDLKNLYYFNKEIKKRDEIFIDIKKIMELLSLKKIIFKPQINKLFTFLLFQYSYLLKDKSSDLTLLLVKSKNRIEFDEYKSIKSLAVIKSILNNKAKQLKSLNFEALINEFGNPSCNAPWSDLEDLFKNIIQLVILNYFKKADYGDKGFKNIFEIITMMIKIKTEMKKTIFDTSKNQQKCKIYLDNHFRLEIQGLESFYDLFCTYIKELKKSLLIMMKGLVTNLSQNSILNEQIYFIEGIDCLYKGIEMSIQQYEKQQIIDQIDFFSDVIYGQKSQILSLHCYINLYDKFKDKIFELMKKLINMNNKDKQVDKIQYNGEKRFNKISEILQFFKTNNINHYYILLNRQFNHAIQKIISLFLLRPVYITGPCRFNQRDYLPQNNKNLGLGMYFNQFQHLVNNLTYNSLQVYEKYLRQFLQPNFYDNLLCTVNERNPRANRGNRHIVQSLTQIGVPPQIARLALDNIQFPDVQSALEWIDTNQQQIQRLDQQRTYRSMQNSNKNKRNLKQQPINPNGIQQVTPQQFPSKIIKSLKTLIADILMPKLYSQHSGIIQNILIECIERFDKQQSKVKNYKNFSEKILKEFTPNITKMIQNNDQSLIYIFQKQISVLRLIILQCQNRKQVKQLFLNGSFIKNLLNLLKKITTQNSFKQSEQNIIVEAFYIISSLLPSKGKQSQINEYLCILDIILQTIDKINKTQNIKIKTILQNEISKILIKSLSIKQKRILKRNEKLLIKLLNNNLNVSHLYQNVEIIFNSDKELTKINIENEIKAYFFKKNIEQRYIQIEKRIFLLAFEKYNSNPDFYTVCKAILTKKIEKVNNSKKTTFVVYDQHTQKYDKSIFTNKAFCNYQLNNIQKNILDEILNAIAYKSQINNNIEVLHNLLNKYPILIHYCLNKTVNQINFLTFIMNKSNEDQSKVWKFILFICLDNTLLIKSRSKTILYSDYVCSKVLSFIYQNLKKQLATNINSQINSNVDWSLLLLTHLLQLKRVNKYVNIPYSKDQGTIPELLEDLFNKLKDQETPFISQPLSIIYKYQTYQSLNKLYKYNEDIKQGSFQDQVIPLVLIFKESKSEKKQIVGQLFRRQQQLNQQSQDPRALLLRLQRRMNRFTELFRHINNQVSRGYQINYLPIDKPEKKLEPLKEQNQIVNQNIQQKMIQEELPKYLISLFEIDQQESEVRTMIQEEIQITSQPDFKKLIDGEFKFVSSPPKQIQYVCNKNNPLILRLKTLFKYLNRITNKQILNQKDSQKQIVEPKKDIFSSRLEMYSEQGRQRQRYHSHREGAIKIDQTQIQKVLDEFVSEIPQKIQIEKKNDNKIIQQPILVQNLQRGRSNSQIIQVERNLERNENVYQRMIEQPIIINEPPKENHSMENNNLKNESEKLVQNKQTQQKIEQIKPLVQIKKQEIQKKEQIKQEVKQDIAKQNEGIEKKNQNNGQINKQIKQNNQQLIKVEIKQQSKVQNKMQIQAPIVDEVIQVLPVSNNANNQQQRPNKFRPIFQELNLNQSFLRDNAIDQDLFDELPEQLQMEVIIQTLSQNQNNVAQVQRQQQQNVNQNNNNQPPPQRIEQQLQQQQFLQNLPQQLRRQVERSLNPQNDNLAFFASIQDPNLRQQILFESTPQFLASLTPQIRAEAQLVRQRRMRSLAVQQQEQEQINEPYRYFRRDPRDMRRENKKQKVIVYPQIKSELFPQIKQQSIAKIFKILYLNFSEYKSIIIQSLIENKKIQPIVINTLLYIMRNPLKTKIFPSEIMKYKSQRKCFKKSSSKDAEKELQDKILKIIYQYYKNCPYKDIKFLRQKISYKCILGTNLQYNPLFANFNTETQHQPYIQFLYHSLGVNNDLASYLIENVTDLPECVLRKIVKMLNSSKISDNFINNLKGLSSNKTLAKLFEQQYNEFNYPKISTFAALLKYEFAHTSYLPKLHLTVLSSYKKQYNQFLNQIYRIYKIEDLRNMRVLQHYKNIHKNIIKHLIANDRDISAEPISIVFEFPFLLDFETKKQIFYNRIASHQEQSRYVPRLQIKVNRQDLFRMSYNQIMPKTTNQLRGRLNVSFEEEMGYDAGGITRQWFQLISRQMFNPNYALFEFSSSGNTYQPSTKSYINPDHLNYFKFIGRIVGKALSQQHYVEAFFTRSFYKLILGQQLQLSDLEQQDYNFYKSMIWLKQNKIQDDFYRFSYLSQNFGKRETKDLIPNGSEIIVTEQNKLQFIEKMCFAKMRDEIAPQIKAFLEGFHDLVKPQYIKFFEAKELELLISGMPQINLDDLKENTDYSGYKPTDNVIQWFWEILQTYDQQHLAQVVQFITGTSKIPPEGFKALRGMHGNQKISIHKDFCIDQLPKSHTCFNQLDLPQYTSKAILEQKLSIAFKWGSEGFGFM